MSDFGFTISPEALELLAERVADMLRVPDQPSPPSPYMTVAQAAENICAKPQRVYDLLSAGRLQRYKDGSRVLVSRTELDAYLGD
jgi:excisionase family DNA binding protein